MIEQLAEYGEADSVSVNAEALQSVMVFMILASALVFALNRFARALFFKNFTRSKKKAELVSRTQEPLIGYKQANIDLMGHDPVLTGVSAMIDYGFREQHESLNQPGFHSFSSFTDAVEHVQTGNVILETLVYGQVKVHELGYESTGQRVLRMFFTCKDCGDHAITTMWCKKCCRGFKGTDLKQLEASVNEKYPWVEVRTYQSLDRNRKETMKEIKSRRMSKYVPRQDERNEND